MYLKSFLFLVVFCPIMLSGQSNLDCLQGIWKNSQYKSFLDGEDLPYINYCIIKNNKRIHFTDSMATEFNTQNLYENIIGFTNRERAGYDSDDTTIENVSFEGKYFVECAKDSTSCWINYIGSFYCDEGMYYTNPRPENWAHKIENLPYSAYEILYQFQLDKNQDYLKEYLDITVKSICVPQLEVFDSINGNKLGYLVSGDLVEIIENQSDWVKIKSLRTGLTGWVYDSCLE